MKSEQGFTLIEVLIALVVLSIGLLGLAMLQLEGIKYNTDAYLRTQASVLAYEIIDRMKANSSAANAGSYVAAAAPTIETCGSTSAGCTDTATLAAYDLSVWYTRLGEALPAGPTPSSISSVGSQHTIVVRWNERNIEKSRTWIVQL